jgi:hypothetical protein
MSYDPYQQPGQTPQQVGRSNESVAKDKVKAPAILLIISGIISSLVNVVGGGMMSVTFMNMPDEMRQEMLKDPQMTPELLDTVAMIYGWGGIASAVMGLLLGAVIIFGAVRMLSLKNWGMGLTASILSMVPCFQGCCLLSIPAGIFALVILCDPQVKSSFR